MFTPPNMSHVMCHVSHVTCHVSHFTCHVSRDICNFFLSKWWSLLVKGLLSKGPTPFSFNVLVCFFKMSDGNSNIMFLKKSKLNSNPTLYVKCDVRCLMCCDDPDLISVCNILILWVKGHQKYPYLGSCEAFVAFLNLPLVPVICILYETRPCMLNFIW